MRFSGGKSSRGVFSLNCTHSFVGLPFERRVFSSCVRQSNANKRAALSKFFTFTICFQAPPTAQAPPPPSLLSTAWCFVRTFFTSLIPQGPPVANWANSRLRSCTSFFYFLSASALRSFHLFRFKQISRHCVAMSPSCVQCSNSVILAVHDWGVKNFFAVWKKSIERGVFSRGPDFFKKGKTSTYALGWPSCFGVFVCERGGMRICRKSCS